MNNSRARTGVIQPTLPKVLRTGHLQGGQWRKANQRAAKYQDLKMQQQWLLVHISAPEDHLWELFSQDVPSMALQTITQNIITNYRYHRCAQVTEYTSLEFLEAHKSTEVTSTYV